MQNDIAAKRKQLEQTLHENEGFFRHLVESTNAVPWKVDLSTWRFTYVGPQAVTLLGYPVEAWYEENFWFEHLHPDDREEAIRYCQAATGRGEDHEFEYRMIAADDRVVWIRDSVNVIKDNTDPIALQGYMFDITTHKQATEALARSKAEFEAMFNAIPDAVIFADTERHIVMNNPAVHDMFDYSDEELIGQTTEMLYADKQDFKDQGRHRYRTGADTETTPYEVRYRRKDGTVFWTETLGTQVKDANGTVIGFIGMFRDITERKESERQIETHVNRLQKLSELSMTLTGDPADVFREVARMIGELLDVRVVCLSEIRGEELYFISVYADGEVMTDAGHCPLEITPCATVEQSRDLRVYDRVTEHFPEASFLKTHNAYSYCGFPALGGDGKVVAVTCLLDDKPHDFSEEDQDLLRIFGQRIGLEIERKHREDELQQSEESFKALAEESPNMIFINQRGQIVYANKACEDQTGYKREEFYAEDFDFMCMIAPESKGLIKTNFQRHLQGEDIPPYEYKILTRDKRELTVIHGTRLIEFKGETSILGIVTDITERKQAEEALRKSEHAYRTLAENLPGIVYRLYHDDNHQRLQFFNKMAEEVTGYTDQELTCGEVCSIEQLIINEDRPRVVAELKHAITQNRPFTIRYQIRHKDGSHRHILEQGTPVNDTDGKLLYIDGVMFDVTEHKQVEEKVRASEQELNTILNSLQDVYYRVDSEGRLNRVSPSVQKLLGYAPQQLFGTMLADLYVDPQGRDQFLRQLEKQGGAVENYEAQLRHKDGFPVWVSSNAHYIRDEQGIPIGVEGTTRDVGQLKAAEDLCNRFGRILDHSSNEIYMFDADTLHFTQVNRGARQNLGYSMQELEQLTALDLKPDYTRESFTELIQPLYLGEQEQIVFQTHHRRKDGSLYPVEVRLQLSHEESPPVFVAIIQDISERIQNEEQLQYLAHHDALTTLPNRVLFTDRLDQSLARAHWHERAVAVLFLDLDRFKVINDTLGHDIGDRALQALSERLQDCIREGDTVARLGGDEFAIVLEDVATADDVAPTARKILDVLSQPFLLDKHEFILTTSIGISLFPIDGKDTQTLLKHADIAMYRAKELGRNTYQFYSADMSAKAFERLNLEINLRHALEREEFVLYYQPQQNLADGRIFGVEALIRWQHPDLGLISPADFVPLLEETGLIIPVGEWVLHTACLQARAWNDSGLKPLRMSVNLSGRQTNNSNFIATVEQVLKDSKLDPALLELEMTESILMHNVQTTIKTLATISEMGIRLAIDDFGTGYSSLSYLKRFPIDTLKIDRSFIHDLTQDPDDATLVEAIIAMGRALNLNIIAEGVETEEQVEFLHAHNCDNIQGFLFSQPLPAKEITTLLHEKLASTDKG